MILPVIIEKKLAEVTSKEHVENLKFEVFDYIISEEIHTSYNRDGCEEYSSNSQIFELPPHIQETIEAYNLTSDSLNLQ